MHPLPFSRQALPLCQGLCQWKSVAVALPIMVRSSAGLAGAAKAQMRLCRSVAELCLLSRGSAGRLGSCACGAGALRVGFGAVLAKQGLCGGSAVRLGSCACGAGALR
eukprot:260063-Chlamydomonas_euryale.AAC.1